MNEPIFKVTIQISSLFPHTHKNKRINIIPDHLNFTTLYSPIIDTHMNVWYQNVLKLCYKVANGHWDTLVRHMYISPSLHDFKEKTIRLRSPFMSKLFGSKELRFKLWSINGFWWWSAKLFAVEVSCCSHTRKKVFMFLHWSYCYHGDEASKSIIFLFLFIFS